MHNLPLRRGKNPHERGRIVGDELRMFGRKAFPRISAPRDRDGGKIVLPRGRNVADLVAHKNNFHVLQMMARNGVLDRPCFEKEPGARFQIIKNFNVILF